MQEEKSVLDTALDRRRFTLASAMAILSGVVITITDSACGGSSYSPGSPSPTPTPNPNPSPSGDKVATISANHGHKLAIPAADFSSGTDHTYSILGTADHDHALTLTAAQLAEILAGGQVQVTSTETNIHTHVVTAVCGTSGSPGGGGPYDGY